MKHATQLFSSAALCAALLYDRLRRRSNAEQSFRHRDARRLAAGGATVTFSPLAGGTASCKRASPMRTAFTL